MFSSSVLSDLGFSHPTGSYSDGKYSLQSSLTINYGIAKGFNTELEVSWKVWGYLPVMVGNDLNINYQVIAGVRSDVELTWHVRNARQADTTVTWYVQGNREPVVVKNKVCVSRPTSKTIKIC